MNKFYVLLILCAFIGNGVRAQKSLPASPYKINWVDGAVSVGGIGLSYWGLKLMKDKKPVSEEELSVMDADMAAAKARIPSFDRWSAGFFNPQAKKISEVPFYGSFGLPLLFLAHERTRQNAPQIGLLYLETMAITGALFAQANGRVNRVRPLVYNSAVEKDERMDAKGQNSFYGGHTTATAAATFFTAKVFNDYFPDSPARVYVWTGAAVVPLAVAILRLKSGKHFLSDNLIGYALGAGVGILVPHLHKRNNNISLFQHRDILNKTSVGLRYRF